eukprot:gb/GFBE01018347.1/.p1 GENE.gb/GFBE01018347.1/~~gb/GFBE01018347.1/.p1  ORF type:complete len:417 (+),score=91.06 gb/GFBE01018347.1/:1-1251(+)
MGAEASSLQALNVEQVLQRIAEYLRSRQLSVVDAFSFLDSDASGSITWDEFLRGVNVATAGSSAACMSPAELMPIFAHFDVDGDGMISVHEFAAAVSHYNSQTVLKQELEKKVVQEVMERIARAVVRTGHKPQDLFASLDRDGNGNLSRLELENLILGFQPDLTLAEREALFGRFDRDSSGAVDMLEFCRALQAVNSGVSLAVEDKVRVIGKAFADKALNVWESFATFDRNRDGHLSRDEWLRAMSVLELQPHLCSDDFEAVFQFFDRNGDGQVSICEFYQFVVEAMARRPALGDVAYPSLLRQGVQALPAAKPVVVLQPPKQLVVEAPWESEVLDLVRSCLSEERSGMRISEVFRRLDVDNSSTMTAYEFNRMVTAYRPELSAAQLEQLFHKVNTSKTGAISFGEFSRRLGPRPV